MHVVVGFLVCGEGGGFVWLLRGLVMCRAVSLGWFGGVIFEPD